MRSCWVHLWSVIGQLLVKNHSYSSEMDRGMSIPALDHIGWYVPLSTDSILWKDMKGSGWPMFSAFDCYPCTVDGYCNPSVKPIHEQADSKANAMCSNLTARSESTEPTMGHGPICIFFCTNMLQLQWLGLMDNLPTKTIIYTISPLARDFCDEKWDHLTMATGIVMLTGWLGTDESKSSDSQTMIYP